MAARDEIASLAKKAEEETSAMLRCCCNGSCPVHCPSVEEILAQQARQKASWDEFFAFVAETKQMERDLYTDNPILYSLQMYDLALDEGRLDAAKRWWYQGFLHFHYDAIRDEKFLRAMMCSVVSPSI